MRIIGIDPGTNLLGFGVIDVTSQQISMVDLGVVSIGQTEDVLEKLKTIYNRVNKLITNYRPDEMAIESPFFGKNAQSMLKLGRAQGVAIAVGLNRGLPVTEYSPKKIKKSVTGNGNASKEQVAAMLPHITGSTFNISHLDASDALATAICHHYQSRPTSGGGGNYNSWKSFVNNNPDRAK